MFVTLLRIDVAVRTNPNKSKPDPVPTTPGGRLRDWIWRAEVGCNVIDQVRV
jgi:hypothetical protein